MILFIKAFLLERNSLDDITLLHAMHIGNANAYCRNALLFCWFACMFTPHLVVYDRLTSRELPCKFAKRNGRTAASFPLETENVLVRVWVQRDDKQKKHARYARYDSVNYNMHIIWLIKKRRDVTVNRQGWVLHNAILDTLKNWFGLPSLLATRSLAPLFENGQKSI